MTVISFKYHLHSWAHERTKYGEKSTNTYYEKSYHAIFIGEISRVYLEVFSSYAELS